MKTFSLEIVTPYEELPAREIEFLDIPAAEGRLTVLAGHESCLCLVQTGIIRTRNAEGEKNISITGPGTMRVTREGVTIVVQDVVG